MKKALFFAMTLCILSAGNVLAQGSKSNPLDRNAVWTNHTQSMHQRVIQDQSDSKNLQSRKSSKRSTETMKVDKKHKKFDFIRETKSYDYSKDKGNSA